MPRISGLTGTVGMDDAPFQAGKERVKKGNAEIAESAGVAGRAARALAGDLLATAAATEKARDAKGRFVKAGEGVTAATKEEADALKAEAEAQKQVETISKKLTAALADATRQHGLLTAQTDQEKVSFDVLGKSYAQLTEEEKKQVAEIAQLRKANDDLVESQKPVASWMDKLRTKAQDFSASLRPVGMALSAAFTLPALGAAKVGAEFVQMKQSAMIAFETMLKSGDKAKKLFADLMQFAAETPFDAPDVVQTTQKLIAMGFAAKDAVPLMRVLGDATASVGGNGETLGRVAKAIGDIRNAGTLKKQDLNQLINAGIPVYEILAKKLHMTVGQINDAMEKGAISSKTAVDAILGGMDQKFGGVMGKMSNTWQTTVSNLKDNAQQFLGSLFEPAIVAVTGFVQNVSAKLGTLKNYFNSLSDDTKKKIVGVIAILAGIGPAVLMVSGLAAAFAALLNPVGLVVAAVAAFGIAYTTNFLHVQDITNAVVGAIGVALKKIGPWAMLAAQFAKVGWDAFISAAQWAIDFYTSIPGKIMDALRAVGSLFTSAFNSVAKVMREAVNNIGQVFKRLGDFFASGGGMVGGLGEVFGRVWKAITAMTGDGVAKVVALIGSMLQKLGEMTGASKLVETVGVTMMAMQNGLNILINSNASAINGFLGDIKGAVGSMKGLAKWNGLSDSGPAAGESKADKKAREKAAKDAEREAKREKREREKHDRDVDRSYADMWNSFAGIELDKFQRKAIEFKDKAASFLELIGDPKAITAKGKEVMTALKSALAKNHAEAVAFYQKQAKDAANAAAAAFGANESASARESVQDITNRVKSGGLSPRQARDLLVSKQEDFRSFGESTGRDLSAALQTIKNAIANFDKQIDADIAASNEKAAKRAKGQFDAFTKANPMFLGGALSGLPIMGKGPTLSKEETASLDVTKRLNEKIGDAKSAYNAATGHTDRYAAALARLNLVTTKLTDDQKKQIDEILRLDDATAAAGRRKASVDAMAGQIAGSFRDATAEMFDGRAQNAMRRFTDGFRQNLSSMFSDLLADKFKDGLKKALTPAFDTVADSMKTSLSGIVGAASTILSMGMGLLAALGAMGKKRQGGALIGGLLGGALGFAIGGPAGLKLGLGIGSSLGGAVASGNPGEMLLAGAAAYGSISSAGGNFNTPGTTSANTGLAAATAFGRGVQVNQVFNGPVSHEADELRIGQTMGDTLEKALRQ